MNNEDQHVDYLDKQSVSDLATSDGQTIQLYAKWKMNAVTLPNASKTGGYVFTGWYTNNDNSQSSGFMGNSGDEYLATEDKTLYAHWHDDRITITYDKNFV